MLLLLIVLTLLGPLKGWGQNSFLDLSPEESVQNDFLRAESYFNKEKWSDAALILKELTQKKPNWIEPHFRYAEALAFLDRREEGMVLLQGLYERLNNKGEKELIERRIGILSRVFIRNENFQNFQDGMNDFFEKKFKKAKESFFECLKAEPDHFEILIRISQILLFIANDFDSASEYLRTAKRLNPFEPSIRLWLGRALFLRGELVQAQQEYEFALSRLPFSERGTVWFAELLKVQRGAASAIEYLTKENARHPDYFLTKLELAELLQQSDVKKARSFFESLEKTFPDYLTQAPDRTEVYLNFFPKDETILKRKLMELKGLLYL